MVNFGFKLSSSKRIDLDSSDSDLFLKLKAESGTITQCIACGSCASSCSAGNFTPVNFRKAILLIERGRNEEAKELIKGCMLCGKCTLVCPRGINTREIILSINQYYKKERF
ncbi:MAG: (4Fe-4S)-binding protein [Bacteroidetes bacterium HGW-Bacteroidetes-8]|jgi:heterodisulfide reductase subunit C|nr:MAG: (4Fe-4S)-binding protein [Bacteroidetes bacterium HGW-Bacteroidetes-8]